MTHELIGQIDQLRKNGSLSYEQGRELSLLKGRLRRQQIDFAEAARVAATAPLMDSIRGEVEAALSGSHVQPSAPPLCTATQAGTGSNYSGVPSAIDKLPEDLRAQWLSLYREKTQRQQSGGTEFFSEAGRAAFDHADSQGRVRIAAGKAVDIRTQAPVPSEGYFDTEAHEASCREQWARDAGLRSEFRGRFDAYLAFDRAAARGGARIYGGRA